MFKRKVLLSDVFYGTVIATYEVEDANTIIPEDAIFSDTLNVGDKLTIEGVLIKREEPVPHKEPTVLTPEELTVQNHAMLTYLTYGDNPNKL